MKRDHEHGCHGGSAAGERQHHADASASVDQRIGERKCEPHDDDVWADRCECDTSPHHPPACMNDKRGDKGRGQGRK